MQKLDEYRDASRNGKDWIARSEQQEREYTGIRSLKVGFNKVFGYYIGSDTSEYAFAGGRAL
ncbi:hypothetical protein ACEQPO_13910 [Bacillus sp. SL00103]